MPIKAKDLKQSKGYENEINLSKYTLQIGIKHLKDNNAGLGQRSRNTFRKAILVMLMKLKLSLSTKTVWDAI